MKCSACFFALSLLVVQMPRAATKTDSVLVLTGGAHAKFVWDRWAWCDPNSNPIQARKNVTGDPYLHRPFIS